MLLILAAAVQAGALPPTVQMRIDEWRSCATAAVMRWVDLNEPADAVADGAIGYCRQQANAVREAFVSLRAPDGRRLYDNVEGERKVEQLQATSRSGLIAVVLEARRARR